jgi:thioredoxin 1
MIAPVIAQTDDTASKKGELKKTRITFVELGSVNCIPCKKMQPVMRAIEEKYGEQIKVIFYDVWKNDQKKYGEQYKIRLIPTQVFLDENGNEFHRHEGFYPEAEIVKLLEAKGVKQKSE